MGVYSQPRQTNTYPAPGQVGIDDPKPMPLPAPLPQGQTNIPLPERAQPQAPGGGTGGPPPPPAPPAPPPGPVGTAPGTQGTGSDAAVAEANAAYAGGQRGSDPNIIFGGPNGAAEYRAWYNQQQGGQRDPLVDYSNETLAGWDQYMIKTGPNAGKYRSMRGAEGFFDKPTECPPGQGPSGPNETDPCTGTGYGAGAAGGGGGGGGGGVFAGGMGGAAGWGLSAEEKGYLNSLTALSETMRSQSEKLFATGMPAYQLTTERWKKLMGAYGRGGVDAALGPAREGIEESYAGARTQLRGQRGAEKAAGEATLARSEAGDLGRLPAEQQASAAAGLQAAGQFGISAAQGGQGQSAAVTAGQESAVAQSRLAEEGYATQSQIAQLQASTSWDIAALSASVNREQIAAQQGLAQQELAQRSYEFEQNYAYQNAALNAQINQWNQTTKSANKAATGQLIGTGVGVAAGIIII